MGATTSTQTVADVVEAYKPHIEEGVRILCDNEPLPPNLFDGKICGKVNRLLEYFLTCEGHEVDRYRTFKLWSGFPSCDHVFSVVRGTPNIIVDGAYRSFVRPLHAPNTQLPDILVVPENQLDERIREYILARNAHVEECEQPIESLPKSCRVSEQELRIRLRKIWNYKHPDYELLTTPTLGKQIQSIDDEGTATTRPVETRQLITYLKKSGLV